MDAETVRIQLLTELNLTLQQLEESSRRFQAYTVNILPRAQESLDLARRGYEGGKFGYLELLDAQNTFLDVESGKDLPISQGDKITVPAQALHAEGVVKDRVVYILALPEPLESDQFLILRDPEDLTQG